jgi:hypothetical protein
MYVQASQCPSTVPQTGTGAPGLGTFLWGSRGVSGCGCGGSCGCKDGLGVYMPVCDPVPTSALVNTNRGLGLYMPVRNPVPTSALVDTNQGLGETIAYPPLYARGLGLFDSMDFTTWGIAEWGIVAVGAYLILSLAGDVGRGRKKVKRALRKRTTTVRTV